jgi:protein phosphatase
VGELVRSGKLSPEEAETHPQRSVITRALGTEPDVDVDTFTVEAKPDDLYLLCSDGLTDMISADEIFAVLAGSDDLDVAARALIAAANAGGGEDNITVVLFQIGDGGEVEQTAQMPAAVEPEPVEDDEDTLSGLDPVPVVDTAVIPAAVVAEHMQRVEAESPNPEQGRPKRWRGILPLLALVLLILLIAVLVELALWGL